MIALLRCTRADIDQDSLSLLLSTVLDEALRAENHAFNIDREVLSQLV